RIALRQFVKVFSLIRHSAISSDGLQRRNVAARVFYSAGSKFSAEANPGSPACSELDGSAAIRCASEGAGCGAELPPGLFSTRRRKPLVGLPAKVVGSA